MDEARVAAEPGLWALLLPDDVERVWPAARGREVLGYLVVGRGETWSAETTRWRMQVVAVGSE